MESLALTFSSGWASGINAYLVVLVLGVVQRTTGAEEIPDVLGTWPVLAAAGAMFAIEFVADKVPYVDSTWDSISTVIRPTIGAVIGVLLAGEADSLNAAVGGVVGGTSAFMSHLVKASERLAVNSSPSRSPTRWSAWPRTASSSAWSGSRPSIRWLPPVSPRSCWPPGWCWCTSSSAPFAGAGAG